MWVFAGVMPKPNGRQKLVEARPRVVLGIDTALLAARGLDRLKHTAPGKEEEEEQEEKKEEEEA